MFFSTFLDAGPNDSGYLQIDVCDTMIHNHVTTYGLLADSKSGESCVCSFEPPSGDLAMYTSEDSDCFEVVLSKDIQYSSSVHHNSTLYHMQCQDQPPSADIQIIFRDISGKCAVDLTIQPGKCKLPQHLLNVDPTSQMLARF